MRRTHATTLTVLAPLTLVLCSLLPATAAVAGTDRAVAKAPFQTSERPYIVALDPGVVIEPILTAGDVIGGRAAGYQMTGTPDGIGWYASTDGSMEVFFNHELSPRYDPSGSRVSHLTLNADGDVVAASYVVDGTERFEWLCSSTLEVLDGVPWYFTGEESIRSDRRGVDIALNASSGRFRTLPHFGHFSHENTVPVTGLSRAFFVLTEDGFGERSQLYSYRADTFDGAIAGEGSLSAWVPNDPVPDGNPSSNDLAKGETIAGHFVRIRRAASTNPRDLERRLQRMDAFDFSRLEDAADDPDEPGVIYFAETGAANRQVTHGRIYKLVVDPAHPKRATLELVLDAEAGDDIFNPDNLGMSDAALVIQEDRNWYRSGYARILVYDLTAGTLTPVARADPDPDLVDEDGPGIWETSGVVDASAFFGDGWWLVNVQAHHKTTRQPGLSLEVDSARADGGQFVRMYIPGT